MGHLILFANHIFRTLTKLCRHSDNLSLVKHLNTLNEQTELCQFYECLFGSLLDGIAANTEISNQFWQLFQEIVAEIRFSKRSSTMLLKLAKDNRLFLFLVGR